MICYLNSGYCPIMLDLLDMATSAVNLLTPQINGVNYVRVLTLPGIKVLSERLSGQHLIAASECTVCLVVEVTRLYNINGRYFPVNTNPNNTCIIGLYTEGGWFSYFITDGFSNRGMVLAHLYDIKEWLTNAGQHFE